ncbi:hypothetical protein Tco_0359674 [Tanacetum coccineum]
MLRHMTMNTSSILDIFIKTIIEGFCGRFGVSSKRSNITGKGKIRTRKLDFKDVYFVKELKFNLFSVSQMCDRKNNVLFTETECLILSPDFNLPDESQVMLKIPKKDNMYSFDLKNIVPSKGLTCLFAKAINDESKLTKGRTVADSIAARLTRPPAYKFKTDCSIIPVWAIIPTAASLISESEEPITKEKAKRKESEEREVASIEEAYYRNKLRKYHNTRRARVLVGVGRLRDYGFLESKALIGAEGSTTISDKIGNVAITRYKANKSSHKGTLTDGLLSKSIFTTLSSLISPSPSTPRTSPHLINNPQQLLLRLS